MAHTEERMNETEELFRKHDPDGEIRSRMRNGVRRIQVTYALKEILLVIVAFLFVAGVYFGMWKFGMLEDHAIVPVGLFVGWLSMLGRACGEIFRGR